MLWIILVDKNCNTVVRTFKDIALKTVLLASFLLEENIEGKLLDIGFGDVFCLFVCFLIWHQQQKQHKQK